MADNKLKITPKPLRGEDGYKVFSIRIKTSIAQDLYTLAEKTFCRKSGTFS